MYQAASLVLVAMGRYLRTGCFAAVTLRATAVRCWLNISDD
jgi:hypothetical protein